MALNFIQFLLENGRNKTDLTRQDDDALISAIENNPYLAGGPMGDSWESWIEYVLDEYNATDAQIEATREHKFDPRRANANPEPRGYDYSQEEEQEQNMSNQMAQVVAFLDDENLSPSEERMVSKFLMDGKDPGDIADFLIFNRDSEQMR